MLCVWPKRLAVACMVRFQTPPQKIPDNSLDLCRPDLSAFGEEKAKSGMKKENSKND